MHKNTPCFIHHLLLSLPAGGVGHVAALSAVDGRIGDVTDKQEVGSQAPHTQLGHVGEGLTHTATKQEAPQLLVQARHIAVADKGPRVNTSVAHPVAFAQSDLGKEIRREKLGEKKTNTGQPTCFLQSYRNPSDGYPPSDEQDVGDGLFRLVGVGDAGVSAEEASLVRSHGLQLARKEWDGG